MFNKNGLKRDNKLLSRHPMFMVEKPSISILGLGYVGAVSTACFSGRGHRVVAVDSDEMKVSRLNSGYSPIVEEGLGYLVFKGVNSGHLTAVTDIAEAVKQTDITFVNIEGSGNSDGADQISRIETASQQIGEAIRSKDDYHLIVYRNTVPPKTTRDVMIPVLEKSSGKQSGKDFGVCFNPEFLREGTVLKDFYTPPKTVIGAIDKQSSEYAAKLYEDVEGEIVLTSLETAEFVKYIDNSLHALNVSFGNEVGRLGQLMDIDADDVMDNFVRETKLDLSSHYLKSGGSHRPKDTTGHKDVEGDIRSPLIGKAIGTNGRHITRALRLVENTSAKRLA